MYPIKEINEICEVIAGQSPPSSTYNIVSDGIPFFQGKADFNDKHPTVRYWCNQPKKISKPNDILISVRAPVGAININNIEACIGRGLAAIRVGEEIDLLYLFHNLRYQKRQIKNLGTGSTFKAITIKTLKAIKIPLPPLETQKRIAQILDDAAALRDTTAQLLKEYDLLAQSIFLEMFGDPVVNPKGWTKDKTIEYCTCIVPGRDKPKSFTGNIPWVTTNDLNHLNITSDSKVFKGLTENEIAEVRAKIIPVGSVIITCVGDLGVVSINNQEMIVNQQLHTFQCGDKLNNVFLMYNIAFQTPYMHKMASSTTVPYMNKTVCNGIPTILPPAELQNQFADKIALIEQQKALAKQELQESEDLFNCLLQKAFKGELV
ncbi:type I restriction enzyme S subunit [Dokdonia sp. Hel_I_63]|uniref:restriction endonuclease subunit S n=1 Tax=Dokdonia sp. Hel_I_63 TaxID=1249996 RepID=UPI00119BF754|nr:restriction endonuclease subunit S [Dokdonia sp. Hel_I_63]TVZ23778.1 type I restriction enzyme S subunit [Dokdonia sp. Hel_I_63]